MDVFEEIENIVKVKVQKKVRFVDEVVLDDDMIFLLQNLRKIKKPLGKWEDVELKEEMYGDLYD